ncbi:protein SAWADEE HOMEODOMAIN HOMOLOG 2 [Cornus florida]|uniref:protein SAWADEE HOMEODOMAIN HOMOLOG 2 n=1 Tax=Cornus florida TaxID=4283 RepID=UPI0028A162FB|nr:protein SAWADEE HOMEODOMAIN HOMOLOG 2 [Cornus florida]
MGRPPSNGGPAFRFNPAEVAEMEAILQEHNTQVPTREVLVALAEKFSATAERSGKVVVQMKQVWNWFQNRRYALRAKAAKAPGPGKLSVTHTPQDDSSTVRNVPQAPQPVPAPPGRTVSDNSQLEFEAKSARDGAWYDIATFLSHRYLDTIDPEVLVRFAGFGAEEDEWVNVRKHVRQRSLPCESSECVAVLPGDLILCFQEGKEQALYFDAHVIDSQRRRHDVRGCRCRFLVRYDHDQSEEIVPLRKVCRRPETDYRLQQLHAVNESASVKQHKIDADPYIGSTLRVYPPIETAQKQQKQEEHAQVAAVPPASHAKFPSATETNVLQPKIAETESVGNVANSNVQSGNVVTRNTSNVAGSCVPPGNVVTTNTSNAAGSCVPSGNVVTTNTSKVAGSCVPPGNVVTTNTNKVADSCGPPGNVVTTNTSNAVGSCVPPGNVAIPSASNVANSNIPLGNVVMTSTSNAANSNVPPDNVVMVSGTARSNTISGSDENMPLG